MIPVKQSGRWEKLHPIEIAKEYARSAAEGYPTGIMKDSYKAIIAIIDEIENSDD